MKFAIGDRIKVVNVKHDCKKHLLGGIYTIKNVYSGVGKGGIYDIGDYYLLNEDEIELWKPKFKVGDRVRIIAANNSQDKRLIGDIYTVTDIHADYSLTLNDPVRYFWVESELELVKPKFDHKHYKGNYGMHVTTEDQANIFIRYLTEEMGQTWTTNRFCRHGSLTCYSFNDDKYADVKWHEKHNYTILEFEDFDWSDFTMKKEFTKKDLNNGDFVKVRDGSIGIVLKDIGVITFGRQYVALDDVNVDLTNRDNNDCDILAIRRPTKARHCTCNIFDYKDGELVYERKEVEEMTLEDVCKALGKEIKIVKK